MLIAHKTHELVYARVHIYILGECVYVKMNNKIGRATINFQREINLF